MAVVINQFEAVAEPAAPRSDGNASVAPNTITSADLRRPMQRLDARERRLRAH